MSYVRQSGVRWPLGGDRRSPRRGHAILAALDPAAVANGIMPQSAISKTPGFTQDIWNDILASAQGGQIANFQQNCANVGSSSGTTAKLVTTGAGVGLSIATALAPIPIVGWLAMAGEAIIGIFTAIFQEHAQAVAKEQQVECAAVPAANQALSTIANGVADGTITPAQGIASLSQLLTEFQSTITPIMKNSPTQCNAGCVWWKCLQAAVAEMQSQFQDLENASQPSATSSATSSATGPSATIALSTLPSWLPIAAIGVLAFLFLDGGI